MVSIYSQQCTENVFKIFQPLVPHIWGFYHSLWRDLTILADDFHRSLPILSKHITNPLMFSRGYRRISSLFFLSGFSFTNAENSQDSREREGTIFYSTLLLPPAHKHSHIYLQLCAWDDYYIFLIASLVFTRRLLDEIYHLIELLFDWLMM